MKGRIIEGKFNKDESENELVFGTRALILLNPNSVYFDMAAINISFNKIMDNAQFYWYHPCNVTNTNGVTLNTFSDDMARSTGEMERIIDRVSDLKPEDENYISLVYHLRNDIDPDMDKYRNNFWWDIDNHFMFFFGEEDRRKEFIIRMQNERDLYDKNKRTFICVRPPFQRNGCNCATFDEDDGWQCEVTGDHCMYIRPNAISCAKTWGEGPLAGFL